MQVGKKFKIKVTFMYIIYSDADLLPGEDNDVLDRALSCVSTCCSSITSRTITLEEFERLSNSPTWNELLKSLVDGSRIHNRFPEDWSQCSQLIDQYKQRKFLLKELCKLLFAFDGVCCFSTVNSHVFSFNVTNL